MDNLKRRLLTLQDLPAFHAVSDPQISPDGRRVAFVVETMDLEANQARQRIWLVEVDGPGEPRPLTDESDDAQQPRWSPDCRSLAFVSKRDDRRQVWLHALDGTEPRQVTNHPLGAEDPAWSPDGRNVAFVAPGPDRRGEPLVSPETDDRKRVMRVVERDYKQEGRGFVGPHRNHVWISHLDGEAVEQVTDGPYDDQSPAWSPDGGSIAFVSDRSADRDQHYAGGAIHVVDLATGVTRRLTAEEGRAVHPSWSPDGVWIAYAGCDLPDQAAPANNRLWIVSADGNESRCLTEGLDRSAGQGPGGYLTSSPPAWTGDGSAVIYPIADGPATHLYRVARGAITPLTSGRAVVSAFSVDRAGRRAAILRAGPVAPAEVYLWQDEPSADRSQIVPLSGANRSITDQLALAQPEDLRVVRPDGTVVEGWLFRPPESTHAKLPLILVVHGGPHNYFGDTFYVDHQLFAALGYAVLCVNPRGSGGYGEVFARAVCGDWGGEDFEDLMAMLDQVIARGDPEIDEHRLGITGSSYGGFMTCWAITRTDRFASAVAGACVSNLVSNFGTSEIGSSWHGREFGGTPEERLDWYLERSPVLHASRVRTPLLLYHGEADLTCPIGQAEEMFAALRGLGKKVELLRVPTEGHGPLNGSPLHRMRVREAILEWFGRTL